jgi:hypothetical protein
MADLVAPWLASTDVADETGATLDVDGKLPPYAERCRLAAAAHVERVRADLVWADVFTPTAEVILGALLMVNRLYARKGSPQGVAGFSEFGVVAVRAADPDIDRLLGVGKYGKPYAG